MKWSPKYSTGIARIDDQHKMLFKMSEDFRSALVAGTGEHVYGELLVSLDLYCRSHFRDEEGCMAKYHCPVAQQNKDAHARFVTSLGRYSQRYAAVGFDHDDAISLLDMVDAWLDSHICRIDVQLKRSVETA